MPEISHVRIVAPDQAGLNRILRELGAQSFPQWMYAEPGEQARILWWGVRAAPVSFLDIPAQDDARFGLFPRPVDDWTEAPRGLVLATVDVERAKADLEPALGSDWHEVGDDRILGAHCWRMTLDRSELVLAEPIAEGYTAACLARLGEGPIAVALDGAAPTGHAVPTNPVDDGASHLRAHRAGNQPNAHLPGSVTDPDHRAAVEAWRAQRYANLRREIGWLTLAGLDWLRPGANRIGTAPDAEIVLPSGPPHAGTLTLAGWRGAGRWHARWAVDRRRTGLGPAAW